MHGSEKKRAKGRSNGRSRNSQSATGNIDDIANDVPSYPTAGMRQQMGSDALSHHPPRLTTSRHS